MERNQRERARVTQAALDSEITGVRQLLHRMDLLNASLTVELSASGNLNEALEGKLNEIERLLSEVLEAVPRD